MMPAPTILAPRFETIPDELKALPWAVWRAEIRDNGKISKKPRHPRTGGLLKVSEPNDWSSYDECRDAFQSGGFDGLGVLLDGRTELIGIDIDSLDETLSGDARLKSLLDRARQEGVYLEKSPSGNGLRGFVYGEMAVDGRKANNIELYRAGRFLTITGHGGGEIESAQWLIEGLREIMGVSGEVVQATVTLEGDPPDPSTVERLAELTAKREPNLWVGDWQRFESALGAIGYGSQSEADLALAGTIARLAVSQGVPSNLLASTTEAVFSRSGLAQRDKWQRRQDYRSSTIAAALAGVAPNNALIQGEPDSHGDVLNGRTFARLCRGRLIHVPQAGKWLKWDGFAWLACECGEELQAAKHVATEMMREAAEVFSVDGDKGKRLISHAIRTQNLNRLESMIRLGATEPGMSVRVDHLDADPWLLGVRNGIVDLRTGRLLESCPDQLITKQCAANFDVGASCPTWIRFLNDVFGGDQDTIDCIQRALGYTLTGSNGEEVMFICYGLGSNGKSVFGNVVRIIIGGYGRTAPASLLTVRREGDGGVRNDLAMLAGSRYVGINELQGGDRLDEQIIKQLVGREPISARFLHREFFEFTPQFTPWLRTNHRPVVTGDDDGIWRRLILIPFRQQFDEHKRDPELEQKLLAERDGILRWMVEGAVSWRRHGLRLSETIRRESNAYRQESDLLGEFLTETCTVDPNARVDQGHLYGAFGIWCEQNGVRRASKASFTRKLSERGYVEARSNGRRFYAGIKLSNGL